MRPAVPVRTGGRRWAVEGAFTHRATVRDAGNLTVFESGSVVRNRTVYFQRVMPVLDGRFALSYVTGDAPLDVRVHRELVVESVGTVDRNETVFWRQTRSLGTTNATLSPGGRATTPFSVNVTRTIRAARNVSDRLGSPGRIRTSVRVTVETTRRVDDARTRTLAFVLPIEASGDIYRVRRVDREERFSRTERVTVANDPGPLAALGGPLLIALGAVGAAGLVVLESWGAFTLSDREARWLAYREDRSDFDEWVTAIDLPTAADDLPVARAETLGDLVDFAIDTDSAVVESPDDAVYHVVHDGYRYTFEAPPRPAVRSSLGGVLASRNGRGNENQNQNQNERETR